MASGATDSHDHRRLPGRSLRSVSQASATDSTMATGTDTTTSRMVLTRSSPTRGRKISASTVSPPVWIAVQTMKASGTSAISETMAAASVIHDADRRLCLAAAGKPERVRWIAEAIRGNVPPGSDVMNR